MSAKGGKKKVGRPKLNIDPEQVERLASIDCSYPEMALVIGCSESTLLKSFSGVIEKGRATGKSSLKRTQYAVAMGSPAEYDEEGHKLRSESAPNPTMLIWLGKIRLGQREKQEIEHSGTIEVNVDELREQFTNRIAGIASRIGATGLHPSPNGDGAGAN